MFIGISQDALLPLQSYNNVLEPHKEHHFWEITYVVHICSSGAWELLVCSLSSPIWDLAIRDMDAVVVR